MSTGFSNEKSAEYVIINDLYCKLKNECTYFYPFLFQSKRDNTLISFQNEISDLRLLLCFARRPKINKLNDNKIEVTFRETLYKHSQFFYIEGIKSIIGAPIGSHIEEIGFGANCKWFYPKRQIDCYTSCIIDNNTLKLIKKCQEVTELNDNELLGVLKDCKIMKWDDILKLLERWHYEERQNTFDRLGFYIRGARPIFIAFKLK